MLSSVVPVTPVSTNESQNNAASSPLRIAYLSPYSNLFGAENSLFEVLKQIDNAQVQPFVITLRAGKLEEKLGEQKIRHERFEWMRDLSLRSPFRSLKAGMRLGRWLKEKRIQILEINVFSGIDTGVLILAAKLAGSKILLRLRTHGYWLGWYDKLNLSFYDQIVAVSQSAIAPWVSVKRRLDFLAAIKPERIKIISPSRNIEKLFSIKLDSGKIRDLGIPAGKTVIGMVAAFHPNKQQLLFVEAAARIVERHPEAIFVMVGKSYDEALGSGEYEIAVKNLVEKMHLQDRFIFTGYRSDATQLMKNFDLCVLPSRREAFGGVLIEAMALGVPVVAADTGGVPEIVKDGPTGLLVKRQTPEDYAAAIEKILENSELRETLCRNAREHIKQFDTALIVRRIEQNYRDLMRGKA